MPQQIKRLTALQLKGLFGLNEMRYSRDRHQRRRRVLLLCAFALTAVVLMGYVALLAAAYGSMGMADIIPAYLFAVTSIAVLVFTLSKAGEMLFSLRTYEKEIVLPVPAGALVVSRFLSVYLVNLLISLLVLIPGAVVYALFVRPGAGFWLLTLAGGLLLPLLPMTAAAAAGAGITAAAARMRRRSLASAALYILLTLALLAYSFSLASYADGPEFAQHSAGLLESICRAYPPAALYARGVGQGDAGAFALFAGISVGVFALFAVLVSRIYAPLCASLAATAAHRRYTMGALEQAAPLRALYRRAVRRYFASSIYVVNTGFGYLLMTVFAAAVLIAGPDTIAAFLGAGDLLGRYTPLLLAFFCAISPTTGSAVSIEGRQWWISQSLPVRSKTVFDSLLLVNFTVALPCWAVSGLLLLIALRPSAGQAALLLLVPLAFIVFMAAAGLLVNVRMPVFNWESETAVVKQSGAMLVTMLIGFAAAGAAAAVTALLPPTAAGPALASLCAALLAAAALLYRRLCRTPLNAIA